MADRGPDRDGLQLDVLNVALGPAIRWWPAGLVMTTRWQGDVVSDAAVSVLPLAAGIEPFWLRPWLRAGRGERVNAGEAGRWQAARRLDSAATLLAIAGWDDAATAAHRLRDRLLSGEPSERDAGQLSSWIRRVVGSRVLRWSLREVGRIGRGPNVPATVIGDAHDRFLTSVAALADADHRDECLSKPEGFISDEVERNRWIVDALPGLLVGAELEEARLIVASLDPDVELVCWATAATKAAHG
ncbi:hypothetical protein [Nocardia ninae]|uniref:hypothetical protein n=1 Tax=Nocardia ninae TaxID=356145 RepID=UPI0011BF7EBF|nr:hypothetical protein [Nocardia ninae]